MADNNNEDNDDNNDGLLKKRNLISIYQIQLEQCMFLDNNTLNALRIIPSVSKSNSNNNNREEKRRRMETVPSSIQVQ
jgi:hypothetical protein